MCVRSEHVPSTDVRSFWHSTRLTTAKLIRHILKNGMVRLELTDIAVQALACSNLENGCNRPPNSAEQLPPRGIQLAHLPYHRVFPPPSSRRDSRLLFFHSSVEGRYFLGSGAPPVHGNAWTAFPHDLQESLRSRCNGRL